MDPQLRKLLEVSYEAWIDSGIDHVALRGSNQVRSVLLTALPGHDAHLCRNTNHTCSSRQYAAATQCPPAVGLQPPPSFKAMLHIRYNTVCWRSAPFCLNASVHCKWDCCSADVQTILTCLTIMWSQQWTSATISNTWL